MKNITTPKKNHRFFGKIFLLFFLFPMLLQSQVAPVSPPTGGFNIDGQLKVNSSVGDWWQGSSGSGGYLFPPLTHTDAKKLIVEKWDSNLDEIFSEGSKFNNNPSTYKWTNSKATAKNDINNGLFYITTGSGNNDRWLILGGDRLSTTGTSYIDFEFLQKKVTKNADGSFSTDGTHGGRTLGDFVVSMEYSGGGSKPNVHLYFWRSTSKGYAYVEETVPATDAFAETNRTGAVDAPYSEGAFGSSQYLQFAFVEAAIDITKVLALNSSQCTPTVIETIFIKTKASDVPEAALKDFIEPQNVKLVFGGSTISYAGSPYCPVGTVTPTITGIQTGTFSFEPLNSSPADGIVFVSNTTGEINLVTSKPGTYRIKFTYNAGGGCVLEATYDITINPKPAVTLGTIPSICSGATTVSIPYTSPSGTPTSFSIDFASGISDITDQAFTNSPLNITVPNNLSAGTYTGTLTVKNAAGCVSAGYPVSILVNQGTPFELSGPAGPVCPGSTVTFTGPSGQGYQYAWSNNSSTTNTADYLAGACGSTVTATLTLTNANGCVSSDNISVNVNDTEAPTFTNLPANVTLGVGDPLPTSAPTANDNCKQNIQVSHNDVNDNTNCADVIKRTFTATDDCGNTVSYTQLIIRQDRTVPVITCSTTNVQLVCGANITAPAVTESSSYKLYFQDEITGASGCLGVKNIKRTWTAVDASGNISAPCVQYISFVAAPSQVTSQTTVTRDTKKVSPVATAKKQMLIKAYPNPYSNTVNFNIVPATSGYAVIDLIDLTGRQVAIVFKGNVTAGVTKTVSYQNAKGLKVPLVYRLSMGNDVQAGKLLPLQR